MEEGKKAARYIILHRLFNENFAPFWRCIILFEFVFLNVWIAPVLFIVVIVIIAACLVRTQLYRIAYTHDLRLVRYCPSVACLQPAVGAIES